MGMFVKLVPRISTHEPDAKFVVVPQPSEAFASVTEAVGVSADSNDPAKPPSKMERVVGACPKADTVTSRENAMRQENFIKVTTLLD
jgi:hypothetical protein